MAYVRMDTTRVALVDYGFSRLESELATVISQKVAPCAAVKPLQRALSDTFYYQ